MIRAWSVLFVCGLLLGTPVFADAGATSEPEGYRLDDYQSGTPLTVSGRPPLDTARVRKLWEDHAAAFIDVLSAPRRPGNLAPSSIWAPMPRRDIPGSVWLPDVGNGVLTEALDVWFRANLARISGGNRAAILVFYCRADCWMSWNAAKRALAWGYTGAQWYRDGTDGWESAGLPMAEAKLPKNIPR